MKEIRGQKLLTIAATSGENYVIDYTNDVNVNIINQTDDNIRISASGDYAQDEDHSCCITLHPNMFINLLSLNSTKLCIESDGDGDIAVFRNYG